MNPSILDRTLTAYRIGSDRNKYPIFDGTGSTFTSDNRWNTNACRMIYCSQHYSTALLEILVHCNTGEILENQQWIKITIPVGTTYEVVTPHSLPGWDDSSKQISQAFGDKWIEEKRSAILIVPSIVAREDNNILINEAHPQFRNITTSLNHPVVWDKRLFNS